jgi:hypothetical protein
LVHGICCASILCFRIAAGTRSEPSERFKAEGFLLLLLLLLLVALQLMQLNPDPVAPPLAVAAARAADARTSHSPGHCSIAANHWLQYTGGDVVAAGLFSATVLFSATGGNSVVLSYWWLQCYSQLLVVTVLFSATGGYSVVLSYSVLLVAGTLA